jgi:hypothetical protein
VNFVLDPKQDAARETAAKEVQSAKDDAIGKATEVPITAFHGSPHDFSAFSIGAIGTGEGAQAFGHGLYFAENKGVADTYQRKLADARYQEQSLDALSQFEKDHQQQARDFHEEMFAIADRRLTREELATELQNILYNHETGSKQKTSDPDLIQNVVKNVKRAVSPVGQSYEVHLGVHADNLLDWDKPLSEQGTAVRENLQAIEDRINQSGGPKIKLSDSMTGEQVAALIGAKDKGVSRVAASKFLESIGVKGISYLDRTSRREGEGTRNYVIFNDKDIRLVRKNGKDVSKLGRSARAAEAEKEQASKLDPETQEAVLQAHAAIKDNPDLQVADENGKPVSAVEELNKSLDTLKQDDGELAKVALACAGRA